MALWVPDHRETIEVLHCQCKSSVNANRSCDLLDIIPLHWPACEVRVDFVVDAHLPVKCQRLDCDDSMWHFLYCRF